MSDSSEENGFPPIQVSTFINGDQFVFRAYTGDKFDATLKSFAENSNSILDTLASVKQAVIAKGVFTGDSQSAGKASAPAARSRAKDSAPPGDGDDFYEKDGKRYSTVHSCKHGDLLDLRGGKKKDGTPYAASYYCALDTQNYKEKCPPIKS